MIVFFLYTNKNDELTHMKFAWIRYVFDCQNDMGAMNRSFIDIIM